MVGISTKHVLAAAVLVALGALVAGGCGGEDEVHQEEVDPHAGHDHAAEVEEVDPHAGHDHAAEDAEAHADEAVVDPHAGHDHAAEEAGDYPVLSDRNIEDAGIVTAVAGPGWVGSSTRFLGEVSVNEERLAHVVPPVGGTIREVRVRLGDDVRAGQVLAVLASRELAEARAAYLGARGRRELAQIDHDREKELWERNILAEQDYLDAKQALLEADIELQAAEQTLHALGTSEAELDHLEESHDAGAMTRLELRSPIAGTVTELHMVLGETVGEDSEVVSVVDLSTVWVDLNIPQTELGSVSEGDQVIVTASGNGGPPAVGEVSFLSPVVDEETRTVLARVELDNDSRRWRPGIFVTASVDSDVRSVPVLVPKEAVQFLGGEHVVFVRDGNVFEPVPIVRGTESATHVEVVSGLLSGQSYVSEGAFSLKAEMLTSGMDPHAGHGH